MEGVVLGFLGLIGALGAGVMLDLVMGKPSSSADDDDDPPPPEEEVETPICWRG
ncbi:hypothetical protein ACFSHQ_07900 [Gemmobacter lanyuensis]